MKATNMNNPYEGKRVVFVQNDSDPQNADGKRGHLVVVDESSYKRSLYDRFWKRGIDIVISILGIIVFSPLLIGVCIAIVIDDPGPIIFSQKRIGLNKRFFKLHKFRTMKMSTPHDMPTHMLNNPEQYITKVGKFIRKYSIDEVMQMFDILAGSMSVIGPRPALWNQDILISERDKYGANDIKPGLTGWAQINGRDKLEIPTKAKFDGVYAEKIRKGGMPAFLFDCRCFLGTIFRVLRGDGVVEGGIESIQMNLAEQNNINSICSEKEIK